MNRFLVAAVLLLSGTALAAPKPPIDAPAIYKKNCASCHGAAGEGGSGPAVAGKAASAVAGVVSAHPPPMDKITLTPDEIAAVSRYISALKKK
jgi:mono/diheme cytochrome c family protein